MAESRPLTIALVAGETSGDILGAGLIRALKARMPEARFVGVAGPLMQAEGCEAWYEMEELAVMALLKCWDACVDCCTFAPISPDVLPSLNQTCSSVLMRLTSISPSKVI